MSKLQVISKQTLYDWFWVKHDETVSVHESSISVGVQMIFLSPVPLVLKWRDRKETEALGTKMESLTSGVLMPTAPEILVGSRIEGPVSVRTDRNIWGHLWRWFTWTGRFYFDKRFIGLLLLSRFHSCGAFGKGIKNDESHSSWFARFDRKNVVPFYFLAVALALIM